MAKRAAISRARVLASGPISGGPSKPRSRAASRVRSPTRSKGKRRRASGRGQSGAADNNSKACALVAMTPSITPAGHIAPVGTMSRTGDSTASCPSHASRAAVRFDSSIARVSKTSMSLAICDKQLNLAFVPLRSTLGIELFAGEVYLRGRPRKQPERRLDGKAARKRSSRARTVRTPANGCYVIKKA